MSLNRISFLSPPPQIFATLLVCDSITPFPRLSSPYVLSNLSSIRTKCRSEEIYSSPQSLSFASLPISAPIPKTLGFSFNPSTFPQTLGFRFPYGTYSFLVLGFRDRVLSCRNPAAAGKLLLVRAGTAVRRGARLGPFSPADPAGAFSRWTPRWIISRFLGCE